MTITEKIATIRAALNAMKIGHCGAKWDVVAWRLSEATWKIGVAVHDLESAVAVIASHRGLTK